MKANTRLPQVTLHSCSGGTSRDNQVFLGKHTVGVSSERSICCVFERIPRRNSKWRALLLTASPNPPEANTMQLRRLFPRPQLLASGWRCLKMWGFQSEDWYLWQSLILHFCSPVSQGQVVQLASPSQSPIPDKTNIHLDIPWTRLSTVHRRSHLIFKTHLRGRHCYFLF